MWVRPGAYPRMVHQKVLHIGRLWPYPQTLTRLERLARDKCSSTFRKFLFYARKEFYNIGPSIVGPRVNVTKLIFIFIHDVPANKLDSLSLFSTEWHLRVRPWAFLDWSTWRLLYLSELQSCSQILDWPNKGYHGKHSSLFMQRWT